MRGVVAIIVVGVAGVAMRAQETAPGPPWSVAPRTATGDGIELRFGGEVRYKYEGYQDEWWGEPPGGYRDYHWARALPFADLRAGKHVRAFAQLIAAFEFDDVDVSPVDEDRGDLLQAFVDIDGTAGNAAWTARVGRQVLAYGSERLVSARYGPNVLNSFDVARLIWRAGDWRVDLFGGRPVAVEPGSFDDSTSDAEALWSAYATIDLRAADAAAGVDVYYIGYDNEAATFDQGSAHERRHTLGTRWFGRDALWDWNVELFGQAGSFGDGDILAWSMASDVGRTFDELPLTPRFGLRADIVSGDGDPGDNDLGTFNPLFPKGNYFGEIGMIGPYNLIDLHPSVAVQLGSVWSLELGSAVFWRQNTGDGVYDNGGNLVRPSGGSVERHIGTQLDAVLSFAPDHRFDISVSWSTMLPGDFIRDTGSAETVHFVSFEMRFVY